MPSPILTVSLCDRSCSGCSAMTVRPSEAEGLAYIRSASQWYPGVTPGPSECSGEDWKRRTGKARDSYTCQVLREY